MNRVVLSILLVLVLAWGGVVVAQQQPSNQKKDQETPSSPTVKPDTQATMTPSLPGEFQRRKRTRPPRMRMDAERMQMMAEGLGISHETLEQCKMIMKAPVYIDGPECLYARSEELGLSKEQKDALKKIAEEARAKALKVLTPEQQKKLGPQMPEPKSVVDLCHKMLEQAKEKTGREYRPMLIAPIIAGMLEAKEPAETLPKVETEKEK